MSSKETETDCYVLKIAYDGASQAGKTTTLRALAELLGVEVQTPEETQGRTLYFDWLEYYGGRYEGRTLRCQVVSVPGQSILRKRREHLLRDADAVVFVVDSSPSGCAAAAGPIEQLQTQLLEDSPAASFLVQANKRDRSDSLSVEALRSRLNLAPTVAITTTVANRSEGVRETFVFAVRLALDRLAAVPEFARLATSNLRAEVPEALLAELRNLDLTPAKTATALPEQGAASGPSLPDALIPLGHIWPPVEGRKLLLEAQRESADLNHGADGGWLARARGWRYRSEGTAIFQDREAGLRRLLDWAYWHLQHSSVLSQGRLLALSPDGREKVWRLWQVIRAETPLVVALQQAADSKNFSAVETMLQEASEWGHKAADFAGAKELLASAELSSLTVVAGRTQFRGFVPTGDSASFCDNSAPGENTLTYQIDSFARKHRSKLLTWRHGASLHPR